MMGRDKPDHSIHWFAYEMGLGTELTGQLQP